MLNFNTVNLQGKGADRQLRSEMAKLKEQDNAAGVDNDPLDLVVDLHSEAGTSKSYRRQDDSRALVREVTAAGTTYTDFTVPTEDEPGKLSFATQITKSSDGVVTATWLHGDHSRQNFVNEPLDPIDAKDQFTQAEWGFNRSDQLGGFHPFN